MTFTLDSGLKIRVPNDQFLTPFVDIDRSGKQVKDRSKREFLMNPLGEQPPTLGRYFLTAAYLMVNHDANFFTLWQANPTSSEDLVPVYDEEAADRCRGDVPGLVQPSASATPTPTPTNDAQKEDEKDNEAENKDEAGISPAVIGGAVGGGVAALAIVGVVAFFLIRKRRSKWAAQATSQAPPPVPESDIKYKSPIYYHTSQWGVHEVTGSAPLPHEVDGSEEPRYHELDGSNYYNRI